MKQKEERLLLVLLSDNSKGSLGAFLDTQQPSPIEVAWFFPPGSSVERGSVPTAATEGS